VEIVVPRDRDGSFEPKLLPKHQRRLPGVEDLVISLSAKGLTTGEICAHLGEVYGAQVSKQTISTITDRVLDGMAGWQSRPLDRVYPVIFIDCVNVKIREGNVANRPIYVALAVTVAGTRDILGLWAGEHGDGEGEKYWLRVLTEIKNRGVADVCLVVCDGLKGLPESIEQVWPQAITQTCVVHLLRNSFRYSSRRDWSAIAKDLKPVYTAPSEQAALEAFLSFTETWEKRYPAIIRLWENAWPEFVPFLRFDTEIRTVVCTTNHRVDQRPDPARGERARSLPDRAGGAEMRLPGDHEPGPERHRPETLGQPVEGRVERLRDHLQRPAVRRRQITNRGSSR
jgi:transposase-like protein